MRRARFGHQFDTDPVFLSAFHTKSAAIFKIDALPGDDAAQCPAHSGTGTGQHRIKLDGLPQKLGEENSQGLVGSPEKPGAFKNSQAAQILLLVEDIHREGPLPLQFQQQRLPHVVGHVMQRQECGHFLHIKGLGIQLQPQFVLQIPLLRDP